MKVIYTDDSRGFAVRFNSSRKAWTRLGMISNGSNFGWMTGFPTQVGYEFICIGSETPGTERKKNRPWTQLWAHELLACFCGFPNLQRLGRLQVEASQRLSKVQASDSYFVTLNLLMIAGFLCAFLFKWPVQATGSDNLVCLQQTWWRSCGTSMTLCHETLVWLVLNPQIIAHFLFHRFTGVQWDALFTGIEWIWRVGKMLKGMNSSSLST